MTVKLALLKSGEDVIADIQEMVVGEKVVGYIFNKPNGTVEIKAQGSIEALKDLRRFAVEGSSRSEVREIEEVFQEISEFTYDTFDIKY